MYYMFIILGTSLGTGASAINKAKVLPSWGLQPNRRRKDKTRQKITKITIQRVRSFLFRKELLWETKAFYYLHVRKINSIL